MIRRGRDPGLDHPWWIVGVAVVAGLGSWLIARRRPVPVWELDLTTWLNGAPDLAATALGPVMQVGMLGAPLVLAVVILAVRRDWLLSAAVVVGGLLAWFGAKVVKDAVARGRPAVFLPDIDVREPSAHGYGYLSGHSAVSMFTMVVVMALLPQRGRPVALVVAGLVGVARIVYGVHLPADVVGGWAFGAIVGVGTIAAVTRLRPDGAGASARPGRSAGRL